MLGTNDFLGSHHEAFQLELIRNATLVCYTKWLLLSSLRFILYDCN